MNRQWTKRGTNATNQDKALIAAIVKENPIAARIFVTGEVHEDAIGSIAASLLYSSNDILSEPLFVQTKDATIQMSRFDPAEVWKCFDPKILECLLKVESERLGVGSVALDEWDFYASMISTLQLSHGSVSVPVLPDNKRLDAYYQAMYLGCLWLYGKGGYMAVPVSRHFALPETVSYLRHDFTLRVLNEREMNEVVNLQGKYGTVADITNPELNFLIKLFDGRF